MNQSKGADTPALTRHERRICELGEDLVEIRLAGEVDGFDASGLQADLEWAVEKDVNVLLDLGCCEFLDSAAAATLVFGARALDAKGQKLVAFGGGTQVQRLFEVTGLNDLLTVAEDRGTAISRLWPGRPIPEVEKVTTVSLLSGDRAG
jgi:anti-sigma B factor antagonist